MSLVTSSRVLAAVSRALTTSRCAPGAARSVLAAPRRWRCTAPSKLDKDALRKLGVAPVQEVAATEATKQRKDTFDDFDDDGRLPMVRPQPSRHR